MAASQRDPEDMERTFKEIEVTAFRFQSQAERFPSINDFQEVPRVAQWRMNLTALSQEHNLYFVAIGSEIHITVPENNKQTIPGKPNAIIELPTTEQSLQVNGQIDSQNSHDVNHLIVGKLGEFEILLACCDDGDVLAIYTHVIKAAMENYKTEFLFTRRHQQGPASHRAWEERLDNCWGSNMQPMFHQNVGVSAWGLAIHQQSRLIAVSSNYHEITMFAFALHDEADSSSDGKLSEIQTGEEFSSSMPPGDSPNQRGYSWKKVIHLDARGHNVPTLAFASGLDGEAEVLLAADILGNLWKLDVGPTQVEVDELEPVRRVYKANEGFRQRDMMGWGVLVLPLTQFKPQSTARSALGMFQLDTIDNSTRFNKFGSTEDFYIDISESQYDIRDPSIKAATKHQGSYMAYMEDRVEEYVPEWNPTLTHPIVTMKSYSQQSRSLLDDQFILPDGSAILRTYASDVELLPPTHLVPRTVFKSILHHPTRGTYPEGVFQQNRLNMLASIPELHLVIVASQKGDAALLTLTRLDQRFSIHGPVCTFRLDHIVPLQQHIPVERSALMGMATSRIWTEARGDGIHDTAENPRWRLLLHYMDQSILSYELWRNEGGDMVVL
ncbi:hypothetical protein BJ875DRAFT_415531 [Amylocarpus encephaloides]|uniref:Uncharacterized protein n=1 Tax=Amylocarpus encephaloides TaxID=45428 RepID=A0A9P8CB43_9HELO|nr:hypothetical protein BJ875DRAFT_415531 [Amylocarpus encephaloides]